MADSFDVVVAGGGHNALVAAAYLSLAGFECCVLDARPVMGGDTATEELTLPGFLHDTCSTAPAPSSRSSRGATRKLFGGSSRTTTRRKVRSAATATHRSAGARRCR